MVGEKTTIAKTRAVFFPSDGNKYRRTVLSGYNEPLETIMKKTRIAILALLTAGALAACETVEGAGRDLQSAGTAVTTTSQEAQQ